MAVSHLQSHSGNQHKPGYSGIHIKPQNRGKLHGALGIPQGQKIPASDLVSRPGDSPAMSKMKNFARNAKKFNH